MHVRRRYAPLLSRCNLRRSREVHARSPRARTRQPPSALSSRAVVNQVRRGGGGTGRSTSAACGHQAAPGCPLLLSISVWLQGPRLVRGIRVRAGAEQRANAVRGSGDRRRMERCPAVRLQERMGGRMGGPENCVNIIAPERRPCRTRRMCSNFSRHALGSSCGASADQRDDAADGAHARSLVKRSCAARSRGVDFSPSGNERPDSVEAAVNGSQVERSAAVLRAGRRRRTVQRELADTVRVGGGNWRDDNAHCPPLECSRQPPPAPAHSRRSPLLRRQCAAACCHTPACSESSR